MRFLRLPVFLLLVAVAPAALAGSFPALTGRVVDEAGLLPENVRTTLESKLAEHETKTSNQVVVVLPKTLGGRTIEEYGVELGRHRGIGQKGRDNGVLFIVAPTERKMRIEVGYGLEGVLTDAVARQILERKVKPFLAKNDWGRGIAAGTDAILAALQDDVPPSEAADAEISDGARLVAALLTILAIFLILAPPLIALRAFACRRRGRRGSYDGAFSAAVPSSLDSSSFGSSGGSSFRGGGGSFGGGGSSSSF